MLFFEKTDNGYLITEGLGSHLKNGTYLIPLKPFERKHFKAGEDLINDIQSSFPCDIFLSGGAVRDLFFRFFHGNALKSSWSIHDLDFSILTKDGKGFTKKEFDRIAEFLINKGYEVDTDDLKLRHFKVTYKEYSFDFVSPRKGFYRDDTQVEPGTIIDDIFRRDFTVNAVLVSIEDVRKKDVVIKPVPESRKHIQDISKKILRATQKDIDKLVEEDPIRIMRAIRFSGYGYELEDELKDKIDNFKKSNFNNISKERLRKEMLSVLEKGDVDYLFRSGVLNKTIRNFSDFKDKPFKEETIKHIINSIKAVRKRIRNSEDVVIFLMAALLHDIGKGKSDKYTKERGHWLVDGYEKISEQMIEDIMKDMLFSKKEICRVKKIIRYQVDIRKIYKWEDKKIVEFILSHPRELIDDLLLFNEINWKGKSLDWQKKAHVQEIQGKIEGCLRKWQKIIKMVLKNFSDEVDNIKRDCVKSKDKGDCVLNKKVDLVMSKISEIEK